jgi:hypothetical protein
VIDLFLAFILGIVSHQTRRFVDHFIEPFDDFARYTIGTLAIVISFGVTMRRLHADSQQAALLALLTAATGIGAGTVVGHFIDRVEVK